jgi:hypothetical protein
LFGAITLLFLLSARIEAEIRYKEEFNSLLY